MSMFTHQVDDLNTSCKQIDQDAVILSVSIGLEPDRRTDRESDLGSLCHLT
jgi:hypothetical protein